MLFILGDSLGKDSFAFHLVDHPLLCQIFVIFSFRKCDQALQFFLIKQNHCQQKIIINRNNSFSMNRKEFFIGLYNPLIFAAVVLLILEDGPDIDVYSSFLVSGGVFLNVSGSGSFFGFNGREVSEGAKLVVNQELLQIPVSQPCGAPYIPTVIPKASGDGGDEPPAAPTSVNAFLGVPPDGPLVVYYMNELSEDTRPASNNSLPSSPRPSPVDPDSGGFLSQY